MNKDVIYIDIEDDITGIIDKVKNASSKIVALVPPKRIGVLQSAVNLKLLQKAAGEHDRRVVLITNDHSLTTLAAGLKMPVAKNLQSRPEIPHLAAPEEPDEEIINGQDLPVGEVAESLGSDKKEESLAGTLNEKVDLGDAAVRAAKSAPITAPAKKTGLAGKLAGKKGALNIPNFDIFRKRLFIFGGLGLLLIVFLVWALVFAPHATITISAKTTDVNVDRTLTLDPTASASEPTKLTLKPIVQQIKKSVATQFDATGSKDIGDKAKGTVTLSNGSSSDTANVPAGTTFLGTDGHQFTNDTAVSVPGATVSGGKIQPGTASVAVTAIDIGPDYNVAAQGYSVQGFDGLSASGTAMAGGTKQTVTVVAQADVDKAKSSLATQNIDQVKSDLKKQFTGDQLIIEESFTNDQAAPSVSPAVGEQAKSAKLTVDTTYTYIGLSRTDVRAILTGVVNDALQGKADQQIYSLGDNSIKFQSFNKNPNGSYSAHLLTTGAIGPKIDTKALAQQLVGKRFGEIQALITQISGVDNVDINLSPFWVSTAPSANKIDIKFSVSPTNQ